MERRSPLALGGRMEPLELSSASDDVLMARYAEDDLSAFRELYARYERRIYGFCLRFLGDPDAAADAFQDAFKRVIDARHRYRGRGRFESWIFTVARRACLDQLRKDRRAAALGDARHAGEREPGVAESPERRHATEDELLRLLSRLPPEQREVLLLSKYYEFTYREIAEITGSTEAAAKQKAYRALLALRALVPSSGRAAG